jgi:multidrug resistance efflux pump
MVEVIMAARKKIIGYSWLMLVGLALASCEGLLNQNSDSLVASGVVEAVEVVIVSELGGTVIQVNVEEGQRVASGEVLLQLDDQVLEAQGQQAKAALASAQANYNLAAANVSAINAQQQAAEAAAQLELTAAQNALADFHDSVPMLAAKAKLDLAHAEDLLDDAEYHWRVQQPGYRANSDTINAAQANLTLVEEEVNKAQKEYNKYSGRDEDDPARALTLSNLSAARQKRDAILRQLNWYLGKPDEIEQAMLDAEVTFAEAMLDEASRDWAILQNGPDPKDLALLEDRMDSARAQLAAAQAAIPTDEQLEVAQAQIRAAEANLTILQVQMDKTILKAPLTGVVMTRNIEPGEVLIPGAVAFTIGELDRLHVTVYIPEDSYGQIKLGDSATVTVDSFPGEVFSATVLRIADRAEFTPRNVQTEEDRRTTVYAVELAVVDTEGKLKPGMPADVDFGR